MADLLFCTLRDGDLEATDLTYRAHPKVYTGFFKHVNFFEKKTDITVYTATAPQDEYRSDDWYYMGELGKGDFRLGSDLGKFSQCLPSSIVWVFTRANTITYIERFGEDSWGGKASPPSIEDDICSW